LESNYVFDGAANIGEYSLDGTPINTAFITGVNATKMAVSGGNIFVDDGETVNEYTTSELW
jgi:hypothetical protein